MINYILVGALILGYSLMIIMVGMVTYAKKHCMNKKKEKP